MQNEIYKLIREFCISDIAAESAAEKVVEYLESEKGPPGKVSAGLDNIIELLKGKINR